MYCMVIKICTLHCNCLYSGKITPAWAEKKGQTGKGYSSTSQNVLRTTLIACGTFLYDFQ